MVRSARLRRTVRLSTVGLRVLEAVRQAYPVQRGDTYQVQLESGQYLDEYCGHQE